jgi:glucosamine--fructose-6-phosphate aminotransferase (isomerizing)
MDVRSDGRDAVADGGAGAVNSEGFLMDILGEPEALERVVAAYGDRHLERMLDRPRLLLIGMGSSGYAAGTAVSALRSRGLDAHAELASTGTPQPAAPDTLAMLISASGGSGETLEALRRHSGASRVLAITNTPESALAAATDDSLDVLAGPEAGGVACRSFACTQAVLALMCGAPPDDIRMAAAAVAQLIEGRERWLPPLVAVAEAARGVWVCGPAERFGSAQQSALMLREGPRIIADACETGDWLHVDVYLTKPAGYALLLLGGSRYDAEVAGWRRERDFRLVSVGRELAGADAAITFDGADRRVVAAIAETAVAELLAAELWRRSPI